MREFRSPLLLFALLAVLLPALAQSPAPSEEVQAAIKRMKVAPGFQVQAAATEPMIQNPVSFAFDEQGRVYVVETHRRRTSVYDIRNHKNWLDDDFSFRSVADRSNFFRKVLVPGNKDLPASIIQDRNHDGQFDWRDLEVESERIRLLVDEDGDGVADQATTFADRFNTIVSGVAAGVLARNGDVYFTCIPDLWRLRDNTGDGRADERERLATGFGVHISFGGHDLHGLALGPDGKLYFTVADRGLNVPTENGRIELPDTGAVLRCNPDGSELELFATGLRNPQELAFDQFGNLWTGDNNGDGGDKARWLYVVEGGNYGWHYGWQHAPGMGPWNSERLWDFPPANTAAYVIPPVAHIGHGPAGLAFYPGTGMPAKYKNHFFMCDFPGGLRTFTVQPRGAGFELGKIESFLWEIWPTDVAFAPGGPLHVLDWVQGWEKPGKGRLYRVFNTAALEDPAALQTKKLLAEGFASRSFEELGKLLAHPDMRVRTEAHLALSRRGLASTNELFQIAFNSPQELARVHAIWGLGLIAQDHPSLYPDLLPLLEDASNAEIRAQVVKLLGEARYPLGFPHLVRAADDPSPRVQYFALLGLGRLGNPQAIGSIIEVLRSNEENDRFLLHAAVMALTWINNLEAIEIAAHDSSADVRLAALLAFRRLESAGAAMFLYDPNPQLVLEAARAIYDVPIPSGMSQLAGLIKRPVPRAALRRALHANYRLGNLENALALAEFAAKTNIPPELRAEAIGLLGRWGNPPERDLLLGLWRPLPEREARAAALAFRTEAPDLIRSGPGEVRRAAVQAAVSLGLESVGEDLYAIFANKTGPADLRLDAFRALADFSHPKLKQALQIAINDPDPAIRKEASAVQLKLRPADAASTALRLLDEGSIPEKQHALQILAGLPGGPAVDPTLIVWLDRVASGKAPKEIALEVLEAAASRRDPLIQSQLKRFNDSRASAPPAVQYSEALYGGSAELGKKIFFERQDVQCLRCHKINGAGGDLGPDLTGIGARASREYILESIVAPNASMSPGFENLVIKLRNGESYIGRLRQEEFESIIIDSPEDGLLKIPKASIETLDPGLSSMPPVTNLLSRREIRDLVEFLASQKAPAPKTN